MNLEQATLWRNRIGTACAVFGTLFLLAAVDGLVAQFRTPANLVALIPGETVSINGGLRENISGPEELVFASDSPFLRVSFEAAHTGFWLGGQMWRGTLHADERAPVGTYKLNVRRTVEPADKPSSVFQVRICRDFAALRSNSPSFALHYLGVSPWWAFSVCLAATLLGLGAIYLVSHKRDACLAMEGKAEVYHVARTEEGYEIAFGLGSRHGLKKGDRLVIWSHRGERVGGTCVKGVTEADGTAMVGEDCPVQPGYVVSRL